MPITRQKKEQVVADLTERFSACQSAVFMDYRGLSVAQMQQVRRELKEVGGEMVVAKNTLIAIALANAERSLESQDGEDLTEQLLTGLTAVAFGYEDPAGPAEKLIELAKDLEQITFKGGYFGRVPVGGEAGVKRISNMRSKEDYLAEVIAIINPVKPLQTVQQVAKSGPQRVTAVATGLPRTLQTLKAIMEMEAGEAA